MDKAQVMLAHWLDWKTCARVGIIRNLYLTMHHQ